MSDVGAPIDNGIVVYHTPSSSFASPDADLIIRSSADSTTFRVFRRILMEASPVFHDMMSMPSPPPAESPDGLPVVEFNEEGPMLEILLRFIYPMPNPNVDSLDQLYAIINVAEKYICEGVLHTLRQLLISPAFLETSPIRVYAIACSLGRDYATVAKRASTASLSHDVLKTDLYDELGHITARDYIKLVQLHQRRTQSALDILDSGYPQCAGCGTGAVPMWWVKWKERAKEELKVRPKSDVVLSWSFLASSVLLSGCALCPASYVNPSSQARLSSIVERIDALPDSI